MSKDGSKKAEMNGFEKMIPFSVIFAHFHSTIPEK